MLNSFYMGSYQYQMREIFEITDCRSISAWGYENGTGYIEIFYYSCYSKNMFSYGKFSA